MTSALAEARSGLATPRSVRTVLMGDPRHFSVQGGANPHTRTRWGTRRSVDRERAIAQWQHLKSTLEDLGIRVIVVPPDPAQPGLVYPANAGFQSNVDAEQAISKKLFTLSNLLPSRAGEKQHYRRVLETAGFAMHDVDPSLRFEGEADFFPASDIYLLTFGRLEKQRFVPQLGFPPWKRVYGFRTDVRIEQFLAPMVAPQRVLKVGLTQEAHYHGDTALCAFGPERRFLLAYKDAIEPLAYHQLEAHFGEALIQIPEADAKRYAANSFGYTSGGESLLIMPSGVSQPLLDRIRARGVTPIAVDVSEFLKKGGGSVKCMIGDLGLIVS